MTTVATEYNNAFTENKFRNPTLKNNLKILDNVILITNIPVQYLITKSTVMHLKGDLQELYFNANWHETAIPLLD